jgi:hypothetical protein
MRVCECVAELRGTEPSALGPVLVHNFDILFGQSPAA